MKSEHKLEILLIEDDSVDWELFIDAISKIAINCAISEASGAEQAMHFLKRNNHRNLIILDLNMPLKDGREAYRHGFLPFVR